MPAIALAYGWRIGFVVVGAVALLVLVIVLRLYSDAPLSVDTSAPSSETTGSHGVLMTTTSRPMLLTGLGSLLISGVEFAIIAHLVLYLQASWSYSVVAAGVLLALFQAMGVATKPVSGLVSDRLLGAKRAPTLVALCLLSSVGCALLAMNALDASWLLYTALILTGVGAGGWAGLSGTLAGEIGGDWAGVSAASTGAFGNLGVAIGPPLFGFLVDAAGSYAPAWWLLSAASIGALVLFGLVREAAAHSRSAASAVPS
jgi:ACS family hexuronate transporter-like MFS transporter